MQLIDNLVTSAINKFADLKNGFFNVMNDLGNIVHNIWDGIANTIKGAINGVIDAINNIINSINNVSGKLHIPAIPDIPHLALGTRSFEGDEAIVGENGPERVILPPGTQVIPNSQIGNARSIAEQTNTATQQTSVGQPIILQIDGRQFAQIILPALTNEMRYRLGTKWCHANGSTNRNKIGR